MWINMLTGVQKCGYIIAGCTEESPMYWSMEHQDRSSSHTGRHRHTEKEMLLTMSNKEKSTGGHFFIPAHSNITSEKGG